MGFAVASLAISLLANAFAWAAEPREAGQPIGSVVAVRGSVRGAGVDEVSRELRMKDPVYAGDVLRTDGRGCAQVMFRDGTIVALGNGAEIGFPEYAFDEKARSGGMTARVVRGAFRVFGGALTKLAPITFQMGAAGPAASVRGSFYAVRIVERGMSVVFLGGEPITVSHGAGSAMLARPSSATVVARADAPPSAPARLSPEEVAELAASFSGGADEAAAAGGRGRPDEEQRFEFARWGVWAGAPSSTDGSLSASAQGALWASESSLANTLGALGDLRELIGIGSVASGAAGGCPGGT